MTNEFEIAKEKLYSAFSKYPFKSSIKGCPCCVSDSDKSTLHSKQLRELEDEDLSRYAFKAMTTWGDVSDYKHYLPRIFELTAKRQLIVDTFVTLGKLEYGKWTAWDKEEQDAIIEFLNAWWKYDINSANLFDSEVFEELHKVLKDLPSMLEQWNIDIKTQGFRNYVEFIEYHYYGLFGKRRMFEALSEKDLKLFQKWVKSGIHKLEEAFFEYEKEDSEFSVSISNALYIVERIE